MIDYYLLTKPGIVLGNLFTVAAGFFLASRGKIDLGLFLVTLVGIACVIASACVFNNFLDQKMDAKMQRTKERALVTGLISSPKALFFGAVLGVGGICLLFFYTNFLTTLIAAFGFIIYVGIYSLWKSHTVHATLIGSMAGAVPPVIGYCAVTNDLDAGALVLFLMLVMWQMPHFFAISLLHLKDYSKAGIPLLPIKKGILITKMHMLFYIMGFMLTLGLLTLFQFTGLQFLIVTSIISSYWFFLALKGFTSTNSVRWGRQMFRFSLVTMAATCLMIFVDTI